MNNNNKFGTTTIQNMLKHGVYGLGRLKENYKEQRRRQQQEINEGTRKNKSRIGALFGAQNQMIATTREALERERNIRKAKKLDYDKMVEQMKEIHINDIFMSLKQLHALLKDNTGSHKKELQTILNKLKLSVYYLDNPRLQDYIENMYVLIQNANTIEPPLVIIKDDDTISPELKEELQYVYDLIHTTRGGNKSRKRRLQKKSRKLRKSSKIRKTKKLHSQKRKHKKTRNKRK